MKIDRAQLGEVLLDISLYEFCNVPPENAIDHTFSRKFQEGIRKINKKSESLTWRVWQAPLKRAILIAVLVVLMLATIACATPAVREAIIDFFMVNDGESFGITFDPNDAANAPRTIEKYWAPACEPKNYSLALKKGNDAGLTFVWTNGNGEYISYAQSLIQENATTETWIGIDAEGTNRTSKIINGYWVEIISSEADQQFVAVWTDNEYIYTVDISGTDPEGILESIMVSLVEVDAVWTE